MVVVEEEEEEEHLSLADSEAFSDGCETQAASRTVVRVVPSHKQEFCSIVCSLGASACCCHAAPTPCTASPRAPAH